MSENRNEQAGEPQTNALEGVAHSHSKATAARATRRRRTTTKKPVSPPLLLPETSKLGGRAAWQLPKSFSEWTGLAERAWTWMRAQREWQLRSKRMTLCETVSLGEKRFLAIVKVDGEQFLVGGAAGSVSLLTQLNARGRFEAVLRQRNHRPGKAGA
jgi:hypothetical protein